MMESMITSPVHARGSGRGQRRLDGTDAVMLSARAASEISGDSRSHGPHMPPGGEISEVTLGASSESRVPRVDRSIAMGALFTAYHLKVKAIAALARLKPPCGCHDSTAACDLRADA
jgi:pyruvate kinase